jgi:thiamine biosynthesis lipoprotein
MLVFAFFMAGVGLSPFAASQKEAELTRFTFTEYHMGIDARLVLYAPDRKAAETACEAAFERIAALEAVMSDYRPDSELMRLCARASGERVPVSLDLYKVLWRAQTISRQSDGAFDVTAGPLVQLWRVARKAKKLPRDEEIERARELVGWQKMHLGKRVVKLDAPGMRLDLGGIGKGYAADEALKVLRANGISSALIELGGDIVLGDAPPASKGWVIQVPNAGDKDLLLHNTAISTSGDTEQYVEIDGVRYSHVVDPATGMGLTQRVQATVIAKDGLTSDPLSTALTILPAARREKLVRHYPGVRTFIKVAVDEPNNP